MCRSRRRRMSKEIVLTDEMRDWIETAMLFLKDNINGWEEDVPKVLEWLEQFPKEHEKNES
jgi:hypothetical protein